MQDKPFTKIILHVNSEGGDLFEGLAIYNYLQELKNAGHEIEAVISAICASSASVAVMAADKILMNKTAFMFIHMSEFVDISGGAEELAEYSELLNKLNVEIAQIYAQRTGLSELAITDIMKRESWMSAETCKTLGFCDEIIEPENNIPLQIENRIRDSKNINVSNVFKPVNRDREAIENMAKIINTKRGFNNAR